MFPAVALPELTVEQMREVDRLMVDEVGISLLQMMENAGRGLADVTVSGYSPTSCAVLAGPGGNGGGGLVAARHLHNRGVDVEVTVTTTERLTPAAAHQLAILRAMGVPIGDDPTGADVVIDALIGYSLTGTPRGRSAALMRWANDAEGRVVALDGPSGLDFTTGHVGDPCVRADATVTLAMPKSGLRQARPVVGTLYAADISVPPSVYSALGVSVTSPFAAGSVVRVS